MPYRHFQVPCSGGETEETLNRFLHGHRVLKVEKQFVPDGADSYWAYQVHYDESAATKTNTSQPPGIADVNKRGMVDYKTVLNEADFSLFLKLKDWRMERARNDSVEVFTIFTNAQLADFAQRRCASLEAMKEISGVGDGRVEKYGAAMLALLRENPAAAKPA